MVARREAGGKERGVVGEERGERREDLCAELCQRAIRALVPELTYEQALMASEVDVAFHREDKESWSQSFSPSLPLFTLLLYVCFFHLFYKSIKRPKNMCQPFLSAP